MHLGSVVNRTFTSRGLALSGGVKRDLRVQIGRVKTVGLKKGRESLSSDEFYHEPFACKTHGLLFGEPVSLPVQVCTSAGLHEPEPALVLVTYDCGTV